MGWMVSVIATLAAVVAAAAGGYAARERRADAEIAEAFRSQVGEGEFYR